MLQALLGALRHMSSWRQRYQSVAERLCALLHKAYHSHQSAQQSIAQTYTGRMSDCTQRTGSEKGIMNVLCLVGKSPACSAGLSTS